MRSGRRRLTAPQSESCSRQPREAIGNLQQWLIGTYHGVSKAQLQVYLDEFVFRHNRRKTPATAFQTLLGLGTGRKSTEYEQIRGANLETSTTTDCGLLKQPDNQKAASPPCSKEEFRVEGPEMGGRIVAGERRGPGDPS
jgi:hypothetical protein